MADLPESIRRGLSRAAAPARRAVGAAVETALGRAPDAAAQMTLKQLYRQQALDGRVPALDDVGFKVFSQTDEDGILLFLFAVLGTTSRKVVEICAGNGIECNAANLLVNHGWTGLLVDGDEGQVAQGRRFYADHPHTYVDPPTFVRSWVTRDNVDDIVSAHGFAGDIDLLSLDMDGVDYWIWDALSAARPRVVVCEYQDIAGPERSVTVPYSEDFDARRYPMTGSMPNFAGASLAAFTKLARGKGYRLVGCNRYGYNAFFVRDGLGEDLVPEVSVESCFTHPKVLRGMAERWPLVADLPWVEV